MNLRCFCDIVALSSTIRNANVDSMLVASRDMLLLGPYAVLLIGGHTNKAWDRISREHLDISVVRDMPPSENEHGYTAGMYLLLSQPLFIPCTISTAHPVGKGPGSAIYTPYGWHFSVCKLSFTISAAKTWKEYMHNFVTLTGKE